MQLFLFRKVASMLLLHFIGLRLLVETNVEKYTEGGKQTF
jgi:hypothetical protein